MNTQQSNSCWKRNKILIFLQRFVSLNETSNQKHYFPIFMIILCLIHIIIHLLIRLEIHWKDQHFEDILVLRLNFFVPCMRPTSAHIRSLVHHCKPFRNNVTCSYGADLERICSSFLFPHQLWRMLTCNLLHQKTFHLISTISKQLLLGIPLERKYGFYRIFSLYWLSELAASLYCSLKDAESPSVGASGALYGMLTFYTIDRIFALHHTNTSQRIVIFVQVMILVILPIMKSIFVPIIFKFRIVHSAHMGGALAGCLLGIFMIDCPWLSNERYHLCQRIAFAFLCVYFSITMYFFFKMNAPFSLNILTYSPDS